MLTLLLIGFKPSKEYEKALTKKGIQLQFAKTVSKIPDGLTPDITALYLSTTKDSKELHGLKLKYPRTWLCAVVEKTHLNNARSYTALLEDTSKDAVWLKQSWQELLWFHIETMNRFQSLERQSLGSVLLHSQSLVEAFEKNVALAENIHRAVLPQIKPRVAGVTVHAKFVPAAGLGGDYYDLFEFSNNRGLGVLLADSKSHGMAALLLSILLKIKVAEMKDRFPRTDHFVQHLANEFLNQSKGELSELSLLYGVIDRKDLSFSYTTVGGLQPLVWRQGQRLPIHTSSTAPFGRLQPGPIQEQTVQLMPGDSLLLFTDGLRHLLSKDHYSQEAICELIRSSGADEDPLKIQNLLMAKVDRHTAKEPLKDDLTLIQFNVEERMMYLAK